MINKKLKKIFLAIPMETTAFTTTCYHCPLKWDCKKWLYAKYNINNKLCNATDESIFKEIK